MKNLTTKDLAGIGISWVGAALVTYFTGGAAIVGIAAIVAACYLVRLITTKEN